MLPDAFAPCALLRTVPLFFTEKLLANPLRFLCGPRFSCPCLDSVAFSLRYAHTNVDGLSVGWFERWSRHSEISVASTIFHDNGFQHLLFCGVIHYCAENTARGTKRNKERAQKLSNHADEVAGRYSRTDREFNHNNETFFVDKIRPLSDTTAVVYFKKTPSNKIAAAFFYWTNGSGGQWNYFFPTDSHVVGMLNFKDKLLAVETHNFPLNFEETM